MASRGARHAVMHVRREGGGAAVGETCLPHHAVMGTACKAVHLHACREDLRDDLYSVRLLETVGQGGQGVVFRGLLHGMEVAVKVVAKDPVPGQAAAAALGAGAGERSEQQRMVMVSLPFIGFDFESHTSGWL